MKRLFYILLGASLLLSYPLQAQTPYDSFSPETWRPMLDLGVFEQDDETYSEPDNQVSYDTILCAAVIDRQEQVLLLVDIENLAVVASAPLTDDLYKWISVDPLVDKNIATSPYLYCNGNPIIYIDPNGEDVWELDENGVVVNHIDDKTQDAFRMNGKQISFEYGSVTGYYQTDNQTAFSFNNEDIAANAFKFMADNSSVEYGFVSASNEKSIVVTQHFPNMVEVKSTLMQLSYDGHKIESIIHNHPKNREPSGYKNGDTKGDKQTIGKIERTLTYNVAAYVYLPQKSLLWLYTAERKEGASAWHYPVVGEISPQSPSLMYRIKKVLGIK